MTFQTARRVPDDATGEHAQPGVAQLLQRLPALSPYDTIARAIRLFQQERVAALPVVDAGLLVGWLTERRVAELLTHDPRSHETMLAAEICEPPPVALSLHDGMEELQSIFLQSGQPLLPVLYNDGRYLGVVSRTEMLAGKFGRIPMPKVGGMATPLGVYLTTGHVSGGAGIFGLLLSGAVLASLLWTVEMVILLAGFSLYHFTEAPLWLYLMQMIGLNVTPLSTTPLAPLSPTLELLVFLGASLTLMGAFLLGLRYMPRMPGYHAAEHQTVNALERGEPLRPESVARMSRVHPRCGTNLWALLTLTYLAGGILVMLMSTQLARVNMPAVLLFVVWSALLIVLFWRRAGGWIQEHLTTRRASAQEIDSGIRAGNQLMERHLQHGSLAPVPPLQRVWKMGLVQVIIGAVIATQILQLLDAPVMRCLAWLQTIVP